MVYSRQEHSYFGKSRKLFSQISHLGLRYLPPEIALNAHLKLIKSQKGAFKHKVSSHLDPKTLASMKVDVPHIGSLAHPIGLAAGFDKNGECIHGINNLGMTFAEIGTITPNPQYGNPKPRMFRQPDQMALINRMGLNSVGVEVVKRNLISAAQSTPGFPLGINIGKNSSTTNNRAIDDFLYLIDSLADFSKFIVINISSPNSPGLRKLASPVVIKFLAERLIQQKAVSLNKVWIKLDPDMKKYDFCRLIHEICSQGFGGLVLTNTHKVTKPLLGGLSGHPLSPMANARLEWAFEVHKGMIPMIGSGGVLSGSDVFQKMARGACAVQIYTAIIYRGPLVVSQLISELSDEMSLRGIAQAKEIVGTYYSEASI